MTTDEALTVKLTNNDGTILNLSNYYTKTEIDSKLGDITTDYTTFKESVEAELNGVEELLAAV